MSSYQFIKVYFKPNKSSSVIKTTLFDREEFVTAKDNYVFGCMASSNIARVRRFRANSNTEVNFTACYRCDGNAESSQTSDIIPTKITGLK